MRVQEETEISSLFGHTCFNVTINLSLLVLVCVLSHF